MSHQIQASLPQRIHLLLVTQIPPPPFCASACTPRHALRYFHLYSNHHTESLLRDISHFYSPNPPRLALLLSVMHAPCVFYMALSSFNQFSINRTIVIRKPINLCIPGCHLVYASACFISSTTRFLEPAKWRVNGQGKHSLLRLLLTRARAKKF